jgi:hypothetical protein
MKRERLLCAMFVALLGSMLGLTLGSMLLCGTPASAQEKGNWRTASKTAQSITGDVAFSSEKIAINFSSFPIARIRSLGPDQIRAVFDADSGDSDSVTGGLYRLSIPADKKFLHRNTLCGAEETQWMVTFVAGRSLQLAFFSGATPPVFTPDAIANSPNLCGTYSYSR